METLLERFGHKLYRVGGCVRDKILGVEANDIDLVIEEISTEEFEREFPEVKRVGNDFPVYLVDGHEVALGRTERCTGNRYQDFEVFTGVGIDEDLFRRDFTHNSIAERVSTGEIVDPHGGFEDIKLRQLRAVNPVAFKEDPVRILRAARFANRFDLIIEKRTRKMIEENVHRLEDVTLERVTLEIEKAYEQLNYPGDFFRTLRSLGALVGPLEIFAKLDTRFAGPEKYHGQNSILDHTLEAYDRAKEFGYSFDVAVAVLFHDLGKLNTPDEYYANGRRQHIGHELRGNDLFDEIVDSFRFSARQVKIIRKAIRYHMVFHDLHRVKPHKLVDMVDRIGREYFEDVVKVADCDHPLEEVKHKTLDAIRKAFAVKVELPSDLKDGLKIREFVRNLRANEIKKEKNS